jgi:hypothetical protein
MARSIEVHNGKQGAWWVPAVIDGVTYELPTAHMALTETQDGRLHYFARTFFEGPESKFGKKRRRHLDAFRHNMVVLYRDKVKFDGTGQMITSASRNKNDFVGIYEVEEFSANEEDGIHFVFGPRIQ